MLEKGRLENRIKEQKEEITRLSRLLDEQIEKNSTARIEAESLKEQLLRAERDLHIETESGKEKEKLLRGKLDRALEDIETLTKEREVLHGDLAEMRLKYKEGTFLINTLEAEKVRMSEQVENLISSKQLLHKTMTGQLMSMKSQLDELNEEKQRLADEYRRVTENQAELQERYRTEQLKTKTLLEEIRRAKYKKQLSFLMLSIFFFAILCIYQQDLDEIFYSINSKAWTLLL
eukprot:TRINITY_DN3156_c0_g1_i1.p2 TRINITY_DN3156_c0_g1~~TRINITY_DN3156_c0_g1_i1.p2  ORF type:complete len:233 (-),score=41.75 TRINITY_DN3156_c0_g1_i1:136-834(-)